MQLVHSLYQIGANSASVAHSSATSARNGDKTSFPLFPLGSIKSSLARLAAVRALMDCFAAIAKTEEHDNRHLILGNSKR